MVTNIKKLIIPAMVTVMAAGTYINLRLAAKKMPNPYSNYLDSQNVANNLYRDSLRMSIKEQAARVEKIYLRDSVTTYINYNLTKENKGLKKQNKKYKNEMDNILHYGSDELQQYFANLKRYKP